MSKPKNESSTLEELAKSQNVKPMDVGAWFDTWPGEKDDGFEEAIDELRHPDRNADKAARLDAVIAFAEGIKKQRTSDSLRPSLGSADNPTIDYLKELHTIIAERKLAIKILEIAKGKSDV